jgi:hypothetical protein
VGNLCVGTLAVGTLLVRNFDSRDKDNIRAVCDGARSKNKLMGVMVYF